jgi:hypothetical protein
MASQFLRLGSVVGVDVGREPPMVIGLGVGPLAMGVVVGNSLATGVRLETTAAGGASSPPPDEKAKIAAGTAITRRIAMAAITPFSQMDEAPTRFQERENRCWNLLQLVVSRSRSRIWSRTTFDSFWRSIYTVLGRRYAQGSIGPEGPEA